MPSLGVCKRWSAVPTRALQNEKVRWLTGCMCHKHCRPESCPYWGEDFELTSHQPALDLLVFTFMDSDVGPVFYPRVFVLIWHALCWPRNASPILSSDAARL